MEHFCHPNPDSDCPTTLDPAVTPSATATNQTNASLAANSPAFGDSASDTDFAFCKAPPDTNDGIGRPRCIGCTAHYAAGTHTHFRLECPYYSCAAFDAEHCPSPACDVADGVCKTTTGCYHHHIPEIDDGNRILTAVDYGGRRDPTPLTLGGHNVICDTHEPDVVGFLARDHATGHPFFIFHPATVNVSDLTVANNTPSYTHLTHAPTPSSPPTTSPPTGVPTNAACESNTLQQCLASPDCEIYGGSCYPTGYNPCEDSSADPPDWYFIALFSILGAYTLIEILRALVWPLISKRIFKSATTFAEREPLLKPQMAL
jgi:hypothetical protein